MGVYTAIVGLKSLMASPDLAYGGVHGKCGVEIAHGIACFKVWVCIQAEKVIQGCFVHLGIHVADATFGMKLTRETRSNVDQKYCDVQ